MFGFNKDKDGEEKNEETISAKGETPKDITATTIDGNAEEAEEQIPPITWRELKYLKKANYDKIHDKFDTAYVLQNKRTGQIVEIKAASSYHACNIIGWKPRKVKVLEIKSIEEVEEIKAAETTESLGVKNEHQEETV